MTKRKPAEPVSQRIAVRVKLWNRTPDKSVLCQWRSCKYSGKATDAGDLCFKHFMELDDCNRDGCFEPVVHGAWDLGCCRKHYVLGDGSNEKEYMEKRLEGLVRTHSAVADFKES